MPQQFLNDFVILAVGFEEQRKREAKRMPRQSAHIFATDDRSSGQTTTGSKRLIAPKTPDSAPDETVSLR